MAYEYLSYIIAAAERQAAMEEHGVLLNQLRKGFAQHRAAMAEKMKSCLMMPQSEHPGHEKEQDTWLWEVKPELEAATAAPGK